jgi:hypothetical protein
MADTTIPREYTVELQGKIFHVMARDGAEAIKLAGKRLSANAARRRRYARTGR